MSGKDKVHFLLEIIKPMTSTRQAQDDAGAPSAAPFCDCGGDNVVSDYYAEVREQPPKSSSPTMSYAYDYYGNPIVKPQDKQRTRQAYQPAPFAKQSVRREDYSEFLELNPSPTPKNRGIDPEVDRGCVAEFGHCMQVTLCCAADDDLIQDAIAEDDIKEHGHMTTQEAMMQEINDELRALRKSTQEAKTSKAILEFELRSELSKVRRQKAEIEASYRVEIAREQSEKVLLQAQLQKRLLVVMEERMTAEIQLGQIDNLAKIKGDMIPTAMCTPISQLGIEGSEVAAYTSLVSHQKPAVDPPMECRVPVDPVAVRAIATSTTPASSTILTSSPKAKAAMRTTTPYGLSIVVESAASDPDGSVGGCGSELASPTQNRSPPGSMGGSVGGSENGGGGPDLTKFPVDLATPSRNRSPPASPPAMDLPSPTRNRSPPASPQACNRNCDPEGSVGGSMASIASSTGNQSRSPTFTVSASSTGNRSRSPTSYISLPLPVASPVSTRGFQAPE